ncbi:hypothetical protein I7I53_06121 [Histoplasma capsulatum var. duboisii H88]|uniref:Uncharacterized protein n=1 Tax=Ajellomyces capsulatus (strain H88) TaxID=544711 RepID=A0A8A1LA23_AJEC8|nr:hypothetical protein I7I53_06121 [Histoplasma capsulatum var. duboisii H88]
MTRRPFTSPAQCHMKHEAIYIILCVRGKNPKIPTSSTSSTGGNENFRLAIVLSLAAWQVNCYIIILRTSMHAYWYLPVAACS